MEIFDALLAGFATAITPANLLWALVGCALGTAVGVLPGIGPAVAANHVAKCFLEPDVSHFERREHQVVLALEVLVERRLADADVRQHLVDADVAKSVAVKTPAGGLDQAVSSCGRHRNSYDA